MKAGRIIAMAALFPVAVALGGCPTGEDGHDDVHIENYMLDDDEYHRTHSHYPLLDRTISDFGSH